MTDNLEKVTSLAKRRGFIFPGSDIYGGLANTYDYGPMGAELLRNIKNIWWETFIQKKDNMVGIDSSLISHQKVWIASGHATGFSDAFVDCKNCKSRFRADHIVEDFLEKTGEDLLNLEEINEKLPKSLSKDIVETYATKKKVEGLSEEQLTDIITLHKIKCPKCGKQNWTDVRKFNLLFPVKLGIIEGDQSLAYLRGETAQGIFINFRNIVDSSRVRLPFGVGQIGKSFRNEITLGNSVFRTIEFEQGEIEYFFDPNKTNWEGLFEDWKNQMWNFITKEIGIDEKNLRWRVHSDEERSFYSQKTEDLEYNYPFGFKELWGLAYRTDYDLLTHIKHSGKDLSITDPYTNEKIVPHVIEPAVGINRIFLMILCDAYKEEEKRIVMKISPKIAPVKVAVFPLLANKKELVDKAEEIYQNLKKEINGLVMFDDRGNIGKRYLTHDEIGTPFCVTYDFQSLEDDTVTVRHRDTTAQDRIKLTDLTSYLQERLK